jgi:hypothetical protein
LLGRYVCFRMPHASSVPNDLSVFTWRNFPSWLWTDNDDACAPCNGYRISCASMAAHREQALWLFVVVNRHEASRQGVVELGRVNILLDLFKLINLTRYFW